MASVNLVYNTLVDLVNKDQQGFVTPTTFNNFAALAQTKIFNRLFDNVKDAHRNRRASFDPGRDKSLFKRINEDLSSFSRNATIERSGGVFPKPDNMARIISATTFGSIVLGQSTRTPIEMLYDEDKIERILRSNISSPTESFPIALVSQDIEVFPQTINRIQLRYYKVPGGINVTDGTEIGAPSLSVVEGPAGVVFNPLQSADFELPDHYTAALVMEIAELIGINLRDKVVQQFAGTDQVLDSQQQSFG